MDYHPGIRLIKNDILFQTYSVESSWHEHCSNVILTLNKTLFHNYDSDACVRRMKIEWRRNGTFPHHHLLSSDLRPHDPVDLSRSSCTLDLCPLQQTLYGDLCRKSIYQYLAICFWIIMNFSYQPTDHANSECKIQTKTHQYQKLNYYLIILVFKSNTFWFEKKIFWYIEK